MNLWNTGDWILLMIFPLWLLIWLWPKLVTRGDRDGWHLWFAWHPVTAEGRTRWLLWVERYYCAGMVGTGDLGWWKYRLPEEKS